MNIDFKCDILDCRDEGTKRREQSAGADGPHNQKRMTWNMEFSRKEQVLVPMDPLVELKR
jgi:hypothetical protein